MIGVPVGEDDGGQAPSGDRIEDVRSVLGELWAGIDEQGRGIVSTGEQVSVGSSSVIAEGLSAVIRSVRAGIVASLAEQCAALAC